MANKGLHFCKQGEEKVWLRKRSIHCFAELKKTIPVAKTASVVKGRACAKADDCGTIAGKEEANPVAADADDGRMGCADAALHLPAGATVARAAGASFRVSPLALLLI